MFNYYEQRFFSNNSTTLNSLGCLQERHHPALFWRRSEGEFCLPEAKKNKEMIQGRGEKYVYKKMCHMTFYQNYFHITWQMSEKNKVCSYSFWLLPAKQSLAVAFGIKSDVSIHMLVLWLPWCSQALAHIHMPKKIIATETWLSQTDTLNLTRDPSEKTQRYFLGLLDPILGYRILSKLTSTPFS